jgi:DNA-directed RNA polymerase subunit F
MQGVQPKQLSNNELLRYTYMIGFDKVTPEWVETLVERLVDLIDAREKIFQDGFEEGFQQGIEHANDDFK